MVVTKTIRAQAISRKQKAENVRHNNSLRPETRDATPSEKRKSMLTSGGIEYRLIDPGIGEPFLGLYMTFAGFVSI